MLQRLLLHILLFLLSFNVCAVKKSMSFFVGESNGLSSNSRGRRNAKRRIWLTPYYQGKLHYHGDFVYCSNSPCKNYLLHHFVYRSEQSTKLKSKAKYKEESNINNEEAVSPHGGDDNDTYGKKCILLAKSIESFKLSDLYMLEANLQSKVRQWDISDRIVMDENTGSCLFTLDERFPLRQNDDCVTKLSNMKNDHTTAGFNKLLLPPPPIIDRCDWICKKVAFGKNIVDFLYDVEKQVSKKSKNENKSNIDLNDFSLDYVLMGKKNKMSDDNNHHGDHINYTSKSLSYRVAQLLLPNTSALDSNNAKTHLLIIDTPKGVFLGMKIMINAETNQRRYKNELLLKAWAKRPFQYSSAINPLIALIVVDLINDLVLQQKQQDHQELQQCSSKKNLSPCTIFMIDSTCGSGTFLAFAMDRGLQVTGNDINEKCVIGSKENLKYLVDKIKINGNSDVITQNSSTGVEQEEDPIYDCAISNLPWGQNTNMNIQENSVSTGIIVFLLIYMIIVAQKNIIIPSRTLLGNPGNTESKIA